MPSINRQARRAAFAVLALLLAACSTQPGALSLTRSVARQPGMPCTEAARVARAALFRLGYPGEVTSPPHPGAPGTAVGRKPGGYDAITNQATREYTATVTITCSDAGAELVAVTDEPLPGSLTFKTDFAAAVETVAARRITRPRIAERPETGLVVTVEPLRASEASSALGVDLAGVTAVRVTIDNRTDRTYAFSRGRVRMVSQEGQRVKPLDAAAIRARLPGDAGATVQEREIDDATLAPRATLNGFLYFPASAYRRATLVLIDTASDEEEGVRVEF